MSNIKISPSIIASDLSLFGTTVQQFDKNVVDLLHMDVMDGHFVPNLTFGPGYIKHVQQNSDIPLDVHLMIEKPELSIEEYIAIKPWCIVIHYESTRFPARLLQLIKAENIVPGIALNPATPVEAIYDLMEYIDMVLIMSVDPGFYGQSFMSSALGRIKKIKDFIDAQNLKNRSIQVDGGITKDNIAAVAHAGASIFVAGSSSFKGGDINKNVLDLKAAATT